MRIWSLMRSMDQRKRPIFEAASTFSASYDSYVWTQTTYFYAVMYFASKQLQLDFRQVINVKLKYSFGHVICRFSQA